ncbi:MAG: hypothetical protein JJT93_04460 [Gammaproteobacteria bacterium]|nr:hypothetical protein [Gammaproteobacteria bacterium]
MTSSAAVAWAPKIFDPSGYSQTLTACDELAAHPLDPFKVAEGRSQGDVDLDAAIPACEAAVVADPHNPRLNYQLARVYGYSGQGRKAFPHRARAVAADYPQALFVVGYLHLFGLNEQPLDRCRGGELIRRSALYGRSAGLIGFPRYALQGHFAACDWSVDAAELLDFLAYAASRYGRDFYRGMLIEVLAEQVEARWPAEGETS